METIFLKQKTKMNKLKIFVFAVAVFLLGLTLQTVFYAFNYSTVYLMTGDIYFGRYLPFPFYTMFDTWVLQRDSNNQAFLARADNELYPFQSQGNCFFRPALKTKCGFPDNSAESGKRRGGGAFV